MAPPFRPPLRDGLEPPSRPGQRGASLRPSSGLSHGSLAVALSAKPTVAGTMRTQEGDSERELRAVTGAPGVSQGGAQSCPNRVQVGGAPAGRSGAIHTQFMLISTPASSCHSAPTSSEGRPTGADRGRGREQLCPPLAGLARRPSTASATPSPPYTHTK